MNDVMPLQQLILVMVIMKDKLCFILDFFGRVLWISKIGNPESLSQYDSGC